MRAPPSQVLESAPFAGASVTKSDFTGHRGARPAPLLRPEERSAVGGDEGRDFQSENAANYKSHGRHTEGAQAKAWAQSQRSSEGGSAVAVPARRRWIGSSAAL